MTLRPQHVAPELLNKVTKALGITALDQWYYVTQESATKAIGVRVLNKYGGNLAGFLKHAYPQHQFNEEKLASRINHEKDQKFLEVIIRQLFPNTEILTKARKIVGIVNPETDNYLEIDFWIPSLKLGIEYQDKHHYGYQWYANDTLQNYQKRDDIKKAAMSTLGYTLITIGYWWDKSIESIAATIKKFRPDLLQDHDSISAEPIPSDPPPGFINESPLIPGVAGLMSPFVPMSDFNPINWYAGEKHDGIRGVFNPKLNKMFSRSGNELSIQSSLLKDIPYILVEGEIIAGRGNYSKTVSVSFHTHHDKVNWSSFRYVIYDIPTTELGIYTQRYSAITRELFVRPFIFAQPAFRILLRNKADLKTLLNAIINDGGEGVIAQQEAKYEYGRASTLAKIKVRRDSDAQVLRVNKHSCTCKLVNGITTEINFCDDFKSSSLNEGDIVSYYHNGYSQSGLPKRGEIYKVRFDISWEELVGDKGQNNAKRRSLKDTIGSKSLIARTKAQHKKGYWNKAPNVREFFDEYARTFGFDPLVPENWYPTKVTILKNAGGGSMIGAYGYSLQKALSYAYPELTFESKFKIRNRSKERKKIGHWSKPLNVRSFFDKFARTSGFDPLVTENWYPVWVTTLRKEGGAGLLKAYGFNIKNALARAYPDMKFEEGKFITHQTKVKNGHWNKPANARAYFDEFARTAGFDPLVPENWYPVWVTTMQNSGGGGLLKVHGYNKRKALSFAYPELKFDKKMFKTHAKGRWRKSTNARAFFDEFAQTAGFDPLVLENWNEVKHSTLQKANGSGLLRAYGYGLKKALSAAYPELRELIKDDKSLADTQ